MSLGYHPPLFLSITIMEASPFVPGSTTGYGSPAAAAALEKFSGVNFDDWNYKLKAFCFQQGLSDILLHPEEYQQTVATLQRRADARTSGLSACSSSSVSSTDADSG